MNRITLKIGNTRFSGPPSILNRLTGAAGPRQVILDAIARRINERTLGKERERRTK